MSPAESRDRPARSGFLIIAILVVIAVGIILSDTILARARGTIELKAIFAEAGGLRPGSAVWVGGYPVGTVTSLAFLPPSPDTLARVIARLELPKRYREQVRRDSRLQLASPSPFGPPVVAITPGSAAAPSLASGDTLRAVVETPLRHLRGQAESLRPEVEALAAEIDTLERRVAATQPAIERVSRDGEAARLELARLQADLERSPLLAGVRGGATRAEVERVVVRSRRAVAAVRQRVADLAGEDDVSVRTALARLSARADTLALNVAELEETMRVSGGFPGRIAEDTAIFVAIRRVREELDSVIAATLRNPLRYFF